MTTRRRFLQQSFCFSAAWMAPQKFFAADAVIAGNESATHALMIGDWGWLVEEMSAQISVANAMKNFMATQQIRPACLFMLGDNFYGPFQGGLNCPRWKTQVANVYTRPEFNFPFRVVLGNHDYDDEPVKGLRAQLNYKKRFPSARWNLPAKWYRFTLGPKKKPLVTVIALDSNFHNPKVSLTPKERAAQLAWLKKELAKPLTTPWLAVTAHHPLYTNGVHGDDPELIAEWDELFKQYHVHFYFCGHDHDLQHIEFENHPTSFVISGGGGAVLREPTLKHGPFAKAVYGFTHLEITETTFKVRHIDTEGKILHAFAKNIAGSWSLI